VYTLNLVRGHVAGGHQDLVEPVLEERLGLAHFGDTDPDGAPLELHARDRRTLVCLGVRPACDAVCPHRALHRGQIDLERVELDDERGRVKLPLRETELDLLDFLTCAYSGLRVPAAGEGNQTAAAPTPADCMKRRREQGCVDMRSPAMHATKTADSTVGLRDSRPTAILAPYSAGIGRWTRSPVTPSRRKARRTSAPPDLRRAAVLPPEPRVGLSRRQL
jgi:hypothetical protein